MGKLPEEWIAYGMIQEAFESFEAMLNRDYKNNKLQVGDTVQIIANGFGCNEKPIGKYFRITRLYEGRSYGYEDKDIATIALRKINKVRIKINIPA